MFYVCTIPSGSASNHGFERWFCPSQVALLASLTGHQTVLISHFHFEKTTVFFFKQSFMALLCLPCTLVLLRSKSPSKVFSSPSISFCGMSPYFISVVNMLTYVLIRCQAKQPIPMDGAKTRREGDRFVPCNNGPFAPSKVSCGTPLKICQIFCNQLVGPPNRLGR